MATPSQTPITSEILRKLTSTRDMAKVTHKLQELPPLASMTIQDIRHPPVDQSATDFLPLRIRIGRVRGDPESVIWMYTRKGARSPVLMLDTEGSAATEPNLGEFKLEKNDSGDILTPGVQLDTPFYEARGGGRSYLPMTALATYYLLLAYEARGIDFLPKTFPINLEKDDAKIGQYLATGVNAYCNAHAREMDTLSERGERNARATISSGQQPANSNAHPFFSPPPEYPSTLDPSLTLDPSVSRRPPYKQFGSPIRRNSDTGLGSTSSHPHLPPMGQFGVTFGAESTNDLNSQINKHRREMYQHLEQWNQSSRDAQNAAAAMKKSMKALEDAEDRLRESENMAK